MSVLRQVRDRLVLSQDAVGREAQPASDFTSRR